MLAKQCHTDVLLDVAGVHSRGFSLLEVMVALVVLSVGLLGILKLEAAAVSSTTVAAKRSIAALEAASLAASMHSNRGYWTLTDASAAVITIQGTTITATGAPNLSASLVAVGGGLTCTSTTLPCAVSDMAAFDLNEWATKSMQPLLNNYTAVVSCGVVTPVSCTINILWTESAVAMNSTEAKAGQNASTVSFQAPSYTLYVEP